MKYDLEHSTSCKKGGLISIHHNDIRNLTANILSEVCNDVEVEAKLVPLTGKQLQYRSVITKDEASIDIPARCFWVIG